MENKIEKLIELYKGKSEKCRNKAILYRDRDDIYALFIASAETYDLVIEDLKRIIIKNRKPTV